MEILNSAKIPAMKNSRYYMLAAVCMTIALLIPVLSHAYSHEQIADSLKQELTETRNSEKKFNILHQLAEVYYKEDPEQAKEYISRAITIARNDNNKKGMLLACDYLGTLHRQLGNYDSSLYYHQKAMKYLKSVDQPLMKARALNNFARLYQVENKLDSALHYYNKSLIIKEKHGDPEDISNTLINIGVLNWRQAKYIKAQEYFFDALKIKRENNAPPEIISAILTNIGTIYFTTEKYDLALKYYKESFQLKSEAGDKRGMGTVTSNMASVYLKQEKLDSAMIFMEQALELKRALKDKRGIAGVLNNMATVAKKQEKYSEALDYNTQALELREEIGDQRGMAASYTNLGSLYILQNNLSKSEDALLKAQQIAEKNDFKRILENVYLNLSELFLERNNSSKALDYYKKYHELREELLSEQSLQRIEELEQEYRQHQDKEELRRQEAENKLISTQLLSSKRKTAFLWLVIILFVIIVFLLVYQNYIKRKYNKKLKEANANLDKRVRTRTHELQVENDERRKVESNLRESEEKYRTVTETVNSGIAIADVNETITFMNNAFTQMLGYERDELLGKSLEMIVSAKTFARFKEETRKRKEKGTSSQYMVKIHRKDGQELDAILSAAPLYNNQGRFVGGVAAITDVTEMKRAEKSITNALSKSDRINNIKNQFLKNINQELRIPLNNIIGMSEVLLNEPEHLLSNEQKELINTIHDSAEDIKHELLNISNLAQITASDIHTRSEDVNLSNVLMEVKRSLGKEDAEIQLIKPEDDVLVNGDKKVVTNIMGSLLENAVIHTNNNKVDVKLSRDLVKNMARVEIINKGKPLSRQQLEKILDPFDETRIENPRQRKKKYDYSLVWIRKMLQILNGKFEIHPFEETNIVLVLIPLFVSAPASDQCEEKLSKILKDQKSNLILFSNSKKLDDISERIQEKVMQVQHIKNVKHFIDKLESGERISENAVILIDSMLDEPWSMQKTMLKIRQYAQDNAKFVAVIKGTCKENENLLETGFDACIRMENCISELNEFLSNKKAGS